MRSNSRCAYVLAAAGTALPLMFAQVASAQLSFTTIVSFKDPVTGNNAQVPGLPADQYAAAAAAGATVTYNNPSFGTPGLSVAEPVIDSSGNVYWYGAMATLTGAPPTLSPIIGSNNSTALFSSTAASGYAYNSISIFARDGSTATASPNEGGPGPSNPNNWVINSTSGGAGLGSGLAVSDHGHVMFGAQLNGTGATSTNNTALFVGTVAGGQSQQVIRSAVAPGSGGLLYNTQFNATMNATAQWAVNPSGQFAFDSALSATSGGTTTSSGLYLSSASGVAPIYTQGDTAAGTGGATFGASTSGTNGTSMRINSSGDVMFSNTLSNGQPSLWLNNGGSSQTDNSANQLVMMGGGTVGAASLPGVTYATGSSALGSLSNQALSNRVGGNATVMFGATFATGSGTTPITSATNQALLTWNNGVTSVVAQNGVTTLPTAFGSTTIASQSFQQDRIVGNGNIAFVGALTTGGSITSSNNNGLWLFSAATNSFQLIAQAGQVSPFAGGSATFGNGFFGVEMNNSDDIIFSNTLSDGRACVFVWGPSWGIVPIKLGTTTLLNGTNYLSSVGYGSFGGASNGDGGLQNFTDSGLFTFTAGTTAANGTISQGVSIVVTQVPTPGAGAIGLMGIGALVARRRRN